jgi:hypothetical protein
MVVYFHVKEWIMEQWERNYYITALAGANNGSSVVVMSKGKAAKGCSCVLVYEYSCDYSYIYPGTAYTQQSYKVSDTFPYKWINKKWRDGFYVTSMATAGSRWAVVMSRNAGFSDQAIYFLLSYCRLLSRLLNWISCIPVREFIKGGTVVTG